jgi:tRNA (guanine26-N2/guanine27-N2)-dimethyltransferase
MEKPGSPLLAPASRRLLQRLQADDGLPAEVSDLADLARLLQGGPPKLRDLLARLQQGGWRAQASGISPGQFRTDAPWAEVLAAAKAG